MELEDLYKQYCVRLKNSLFVSFVAVGGVSATIILIALLASAKVINLILVTAFKSNLLTTI